MTSPIRTISSPTYILANSDDDSYVVTLPFTFWGETIAVITSNCYIGFSNSANPFYYSYILENIPFKMVGITFDGDSRSTTVGTTCSYGSVTDGVNTGFGVTYYNWGWYSINYSPPSTFQLVLWPDGSSEINVETFGVISNRNVYAGWKNVAATNTGKSYTIPGSTIGGYHHYGDGDTNALSTNSNIGVSGRWVYYPPDSADTAVAVATSAQAYVDRQGLANVTVSPTASILGNWSMHSDANALTVSLFPYARGLLPAIENEANATRVDTAASASATVEHKANAATTGVTVATTSTGILVRVGRASVVITPTVQTFATAGPLFEVGVVIRTSTTLHMTVQGAIYYPSTPVPQTPPELVDGNWSYSSPVYGGVVLRALHGVVVDMDYPTIIEGIPES